MDYSNNYEEEYGYDEDEDVITAEDCWDVINSFFDDKGLVSQQIESYDEFVTKHMQDVVNEDSRVILDQNSPPDDDLDNPIIKRRYEISFGVVKVSVPIITEGDGVSHNMWPHEARLRGLTYSCPMYVPMAKKVMEAREHPTGEEDGRDGEEEEQEGGSMMRLYWKTVQADPHPKEAHIGRMPTMLKSIFCSLRGKSDDILFSHDECPYDQGGYFIINGSEKVLISQERSAANIVQVFKKKQSPTPVIAEIRSAIERGSRLVSSIQVKLFEKGVGAKGVSDQFIRTSLPYIKADIPIVVVFRALGVVSDETVLDHIVYDKTDTQMLEMLKPCLEEAFVIQDREEALDFIGKRGSQSGTKDKRIRYAREVLQKEFLPHISQKEGSETKKAFFLGYIVHRLLQVALGRREEDDRDHFGKKRLELAGPLLCQLFRTMYKKMKGDVLRHLQKCVETNREFNSLLAIKHHTISNGLKYALATGNWGEQKKAASSKAGVSQVLNRYTFASTLSHLRRTNTPIGRDGKIAKPRQLHNTHWGLVCPAETPEGQACGLVKNLSLMCYVSIGSPGEPIIDYLTMRGMELLEEFDPHSAQDATKIFVNGVWVGVHREPTRLHNNLRTIRGDPNYLIEEVSIIRDIRERELRILTDAGRVMRPLFVVEYRPEYYNRKGELVLRREHLTQLAADKESVPSYDDREDELETGKKGWARLVKEKVVEYLDAEEEETAMIAMTPEDLGELRHLQQYNQPMEKSTNDAHARIKPKMNPSISRFTHCEIHPAMILGVCASIIPFPDHNQVSLELRSLIIVLICSLLVTPTNLPWVNKLWVSCSRTTTCEWKPWSMFCTTRRSHWRPLDLWSI